MRLDLEAHLKRQIAFSRGTYGPGNRMGGVVDHIRKELIEVENSAGDPDEWTDVVILALDGLTRSIRELYGYTTDEAAAEAVKRIVFKQNRNEGRTWPDWRGSSPDRAIEHDRSKDVQDDDIPF